MTAACWSCGAPAVRVTCGAPACRLARRRHINRPSHIRQAARRKAERAACPVPIGRPRTTDTADAIEARYQTARMWRRRIERAARFTEVAS